MKRLFVALFLMSSAAGFAQSEDHHQHQHHLTEKCHFDALYEAAAQDPIQREELIQLENTIAERVEEIKDSWKQTSNKSNTVLYTIPVVVHVIYASSRSNISKAQILDGLRVLNEDFQRLNADASQTRAAFLPDAADAQIEFKLATKDPNQNCTDGIVRYYDTRTNSATDNVKSGRSWNTQRYLNIWIINEFDPVQIGSNVLGYSRFPRINSPFSVDGVILRHDQMGTIGTALEGLGAQNGRTLTHEVGHYLALHHPFAGGCNGIGGSQNIPGLLGNAAQNDYCDDTPPVDQANFGCNLGATSCNNLDQIENYMDYADCQNMFSLDQKARMHAVLTDSRFRTQLVSQSNLNFTGVNNPVACTPNPTISSDRKATCPGDTVTFFDNFDINNASSWSWSFPGGTPSTSSDANPKVVYSNPGTYSVSLTASTSAGSNSVTETNFIEVKHGANPLFTTTWIQSFENSAFPINMTAVDQGDNNPFQLFTNAGSHQNQSLILPSERNHLGELDEIISPAIDVSNGNDLNLFFDFAFAARDNDNTDQLEVYVSRDCGETWTRRRFYNGGRLRTVNNTTSNFVPNGPGDWSTETINFNAYIGPDPILIKFVFENGGGNNFYIDNIRFGEGQDVSLGELSAVDMALYPNPTEGLVNVKLSDLNDRDLQLAIYDLSGKQVFVQELEAQGPSLDLKLDLALKPGLYIVDLKGENTQLQEKLRVE